jgi:hypothetical protein
VKEGRKFLAIFIKRNFKIFLRFFQVFRTSNCLKKCFSTLNRSSLLGLLDQEKIKKFLFSFLTPSLFEKKEGQETEQKKKKFLSNSNNTC